MENDQKSTSKAEEIGVLREVVAVLRGRNVARSPHISRRDNNELWAMSEQIDMIIARMEGEYDGLTTVAATLAVNERMRATGEAYDRALAWVIANHQGK